MKEKAENIIGGIIFALCVIPVFLWSLISTLWNEGGDGCTGGDGMHG